MIYVIKILLKLNHILERLILKVKLSDFKGLVCFKPVGIDDDYRILRHKAQRKTRQI